jgi:leader peptidase (prepilin peptidase) / N-methyltransferase
MGVADLASLILWGAVGACVGSFVNVVAYRLPLGISLVYPASRCPSCHSALGPTENVPILGWLLLRGRCKSCQAPISARYPLIEALMALLFMGVALWMQNSLGNVGTSSGWGAVIGYSLWIAALVSLALVDWDTMELPDEITRPFVALGVLFHTLVPLLATDDGNQASIGLMQSLWGIVFALGLFDVLSYGSEKLLGKEGMGGGDAKLAAMLGAWLGWQGLLVALAVGFLSGALGGVLAMALKWIKQGEVFPFGPFLVFGGIVSLFAQDVLVSSYLNLIGW